MGDSSTMVMVCTHAMSNGGAKMSLLILGVNPYIHSYIKETT